MDLICAAPVEYREHSAFASRCGPAPVEWFHPQAAKMRVPAHRITAVGYGAARPIANNGTKEGRAKNRRIDLLITPENGAAF